MGRSKGRYEELTWAPDFSRPGGITSRAGSYRAFVPATIGQAELELSSGSAALVERAATAVRALNESPGELVSLEGLARLLLRSEALASSQIEGLSVSHRKLAEAELEGQEGHHKATEIMANVRAMETAVAIGAQAEAISIDDIAAIHAAMAIVPPLDRIAGEIREEISWIGGTAPPDAEYVGPPARHVRPLLEDLCVFMGRDDLPIVQQAAIAHAQFELIHPFGDGNGRVGRCLIHVLLHRRGAAPRYVPPISLVLGANKDAYIAGLRKFQEHRDELWINQFARAVETAAENARRFSDAVLELQDRWREQVVPIRADSAALGVIEILPRYPIVTAAVAEKELGKSRPAAINGLDRLAGEGILTRRRNQRKGDSWESKQLFELLGEFEAAVRTPAG